MKQRWQFEQHTYAKALLQNNYDYTSLTSDSVFFFFLDNEDDVHVIEAAQDIL